MFLSLFLGRTYTCALGQIYPFNTIKGVLSVEKTNDCERPCLLLCLIGSQTCLLTPWFWIANRDQPVGAKNSKPSLLKNGNIKDADHKVLRTINTVSQSSVEAQLFNTGNLVLRTWEDVTLGESFDFPTDTLLPQQPLTKDIYHISSRSQSNYSSTNYKLFFFPFFSFFLQQ
ncbi:hypothetical protein ACOSQ4_010737 [Xanthoceras sorbifolium]